MAGRGWPGKHANHGAWHTCVRYGIRSNLDEMIWEQGRLVSPQASDTLSGGSFGLLGSRDADVARHIAHDTSDLQPHPKLHQMNTPDEEVWFTST